MQSNPKFPAQFSADLVKFTEEIINGKLYFLCSDYSYSTRIGVDVKRRHVWSCTNLILTYVLFLAPHFFFRGTKILGNFGKSPKINLLQSPLLVKLRVLKRNSILLFSKDFFKFPDQTFLKTLLCGCFSYPKL